MVQPISASGIQPTALPAAAAARDGTGAAYANTWSAPPPLIRAQAIVGAATPAASGGSIPASVARAQESALLAADVYRDVPAPPAGFRVAAPADLERLNLTPAMLERDGSSFRARVYATGDGADTRFVVAFRGSQTGEDWRNNFQQAAGANSESYRKALAVGEAIGRSDASITITGHSLGGGLAAASAVASGREADTFNAAGLADRTIDAAKGFNRANGGGGRDVAVQAYNVPGEILTHLQDGADRVLGAVLFGVPGALLADAPSAYGTRHTLPEAVPDGKSWFAEHSRIDRHMIDWVVAGAAALR